MWGIAFGGVCVFFFVFFVSTSLLENGHSYHDETKLQTFGTHGSTMLLLNFGLNWGQNPYHWVRKCLCQNFARSEGCKD